MSKMPEELFLCSLLARPGSLPGQEQTGLHGAGRSLRTPLVTCLQPLMPSLPGKSPGDNQIPLSRAWSLPSPLPSPGSICGKVNGSYRASSFSPSSLQRVCCQGQVVTAHVGDVWPRQHDSKSPLNPRSMLSLAS